MVIQTNQSPKKTTLFDKELRLVIYIQKKLSPYFDYPAIVLHYLMTDEVLMLLGPITTFLFNYYTGIVLALSCLIAEIYAGIIKWACRMPRPLWLDMNGELINRRGEWESTYGFPSAHSMLATSMTVINLLIYIDIKSDADFMADHHVNEGRNIFLISFCLGIILCLTTGLSRIYFAVHYPRDVIVGYILGPLCGLSVYYLFKVTRDINEWASIAVGVVLVGITLSMMIAVRRMFPADKVDMPMWEANALRAWNARKGENVTKHPVGIHPRSIAGYVCIYGIVFGIWISDPLFRLANDGKAYYECQEWTKTKGIRFGIGFPGIVLFLILIFIIIPKISKRKAFLYPAKAIFGFLYGLWLCLLPQVIFQSAGYNKC